MLLLQLRHGMSSKCSFRSLSIFRNFKRNFITSVGIFGEPKLKKADGFLVMETQARRECENFVQEALNPNRQRKMVQIFDDLSDSICRVADLAECMRNLHPNAEFANSAEECVASMGQLVESFNTNIELYNCLKKNLNEGDAVDQRVSSLLAADFEASGVHLQEKQRNEFVAISSNIFRLSSEFVRKCDQPTELRGSASENNESIFLDNPSLNSPDSIVREAGYKMFYKHSASQESLLKNLLTQRHRLARTAGFPTFAHRALRGSLLETPNNVETFLLSLIKQLKPYVQQDMLELKKYSSTGDVRLWDIPYLTYLARREYLGDIAAELSNFSDTTSVLCGINEITQALFNITVERTEAERGELWDADVDKLFVKDHNGNILGTIYCDWFDRSSKVVSDSHFTIRCGRQLHDGSYQQPIVVLTFRHQKRRNRRYLNINEVENVLHEFGHALHSVLGRTRYQHVSGTRCPTDFAEIPSNLMEHFLLHNKTWDLFGRNLKTKDTNSFNKMRRSTKLFSSLDLLKQSVYALFDLRLHSTDSIDRSTTKMFEELCHDTWPLMFVPDTAWHHRFSHLVHYGSKYHAYLVAAASASAIWRHSFAANPLSRGVGEKWREVLSYGGERSPADLLSLILKKPLSVSELSEAAVENIRA